MVMETLQPYCLPRWLNTILPAAALLCMAIGSVHGQDLRPAPRTADWRSLPEVELETRRDMDKEPGSVRGFLESLRGNDAAIRLVVGQSRLLTTKTAIASEQGTSVIAVGDPSIVDFDILPDPQLRMIRLVGRRVGVTDLTYVGIDREPYSFEIHVVYDLELLRAQLRQHFPDAQVSLGQIREHIVVEGQARSTDQVQQILDTINVFLASVQTSGSTQGGQGSGASGPPDQPRGNGQARPREAPGDEDFDDQTSTPVMVHEEGGLSRSQATIAQPQIINLLQVPGVHQVMLKVQLAELNRRALRQIGADLTYAAAGTFLQSIASGGGNLVGVFNGGEFTIVLNALRRNDVAKILAEPNLITLNGHTARFQSGGEFPVPVAQMGGGAGNNRVEFKPFGVQLAFIPYVQDNGLIRLRVEPEVSTIDETLAVSLIAGGDPIPGLRTRNASTTVELREGQTLAIAGLLNYEMTGQTSRVPFLGDLPYIGPLFATTRNEVLEQELLVVVTPFLVSPTDACQRIALPGDDILEPNDLELYLLNRIEGRTGHPFRATTQWDNPFSLQRQREWEQSYIYGPVGQSH